MGTPIGNLWSDITPVVSQAAIKYPTQKPLALLERIIKASSNDGDIVLDPFCGCATTCVAAEKLNRQWIGIDISVKAYELVRSRLNDEVYKQGLLNGVSEDRSPPKLPEIVFSTSAPVRTDREADSRDRKYVYVISHPKYPGEYKVGIAANLKRRLTSYQTSDPDRSFKIEHSVHTEHYRELERHIHETFENKHEWVHSTLKDIIDEIGNY